MNNPCSVNVPCYPCYESPINNFSAEDPDPLTYRGTSYNGGDGDGPGRGPTWGALGCLFYCTSTISQEDADLCAARQSWLCNRDKGNFPGIPPNGQFFLNAQVDCCAVCPDGLQFCFTVAAGQFIAQSQILADREAHSYACRRAQTNKVCLSDVTPNQCCVGSPFTGTITATGRFVDTANLGNVWEIVSGSLPTGLTFNGGFQNDTVTIDGTPTVAGTFTFTVRVTEPNGDYMQKVETLCVVDMLPNPSGSDDSTFPDATIGQAYNNALAVTGCATGPISYQVTTGSLPPGLSLDESTGILSGTPTGSPTSYVFTITIQAPAT